MKKATTMSETTHWVVPIPADSLHVEMARFCCAVGQRLKESKA